MKIMVGGKVYNTEETPVVIEFEDHEQETFGVTTDKLVSAPPHYTSVDLEYLLKRDFETYEEKAVLIDKQGNEYGEVLLGVDIERLSGTVYVVESINYGECEGAIAVFSTEELAKEYIGTVFNSGEPGIGYPIRPMVLDKPGEEV